MGRSKFPGKPSKHVNKKRVSVLQGSELSGLQSSFGGENSDYLPSDQVSLWNSRNETAKFGNDGAFQTTSVPGSSEKPPPSEPPDGGGGGRFRSVIKIDKPFNSGMSSKTNPSAYLASTNNSDIDFHSFRRIGDKDKPKKKTVTFKTILETSDDASAVKRVYNPDNKAPLVSIIKKECLSRASRLTRSECIVRPSRLSAIWKNNSSSIDKVESLSISDATSNAKEETPSSPTKQTFSLTTASERTESSFAPSLSETSSTVASHSAEHDSNCSKKPEKTSHGETTGTKDKRFILPKRSVHSSRVIKPNKRFFDDTTTAHTKQTSITADSTKNASSKVENNGELESDSKFQSRNSDNEKECSDYRRSNNKSPQNSDSTSVVESASSATFSKHVKTSQTSILEATNTDSTDDESEIAYNKILSNRRILGNMISSAKSILRQPRLQFDTPTTTTHSLTAFVLNQQKLFNDNEAAEQGNASSCEVCGSSHGNSSQKMTDLKTFSCDVCRKFVTKTIKKLVNSTNVDSSRNVLQCIKGDGSCSISPVQSNKYKTSKKTLRERCHACWLKKCLKSFNLSSGVRKLLNARLPATFLSESPCSAASTSTFGSISASTSSKENSSKGSGLFSNLSGSLTNWADGVEKIQQLPSNALTENNTTFGSSPLIGHSVLEKHVFTATPKNTPSSDETTATTTTTSTPKNLLELTKSVMNINTDSKESPSTSSLIEEDNKTKKTTTPAVVSSTMTATATTSSEGVGKRQRIDLKGPRVKHVCRSASVVLGQPIATFETEAEGEEGAENLMDNEDTVEPEPASILTELINDNVSPETTSSDSADQLKDDLDNCDNCSKTETNLQIASSQSCMMSSSSSSSSSDEERPESIEAVKKVLVETQKPLTRKISRTLANRKVLQRGQTTNQPRTISVDFWESYDPTEVNQTGFGLIITEEICVRALCFLCGSAGQDPLIFCACCCEPYHQYCVEDEYNLKHSSFDDTITSLFDTSINVATNLNAITNRLNWLCPRCTVCYTCNMSSGLKVKCQKCQKYYHNTCLGTSKRLLGADRPLICANCLKCKSCGTANVTKFVGNLPLCSQCFKLRKKGNYCPLCQKCYEDNDFDLKMMECGDCERWVHAKCEGLSDEQYNMLSTLPENIEFICRKCSSTNSQSKVWRDAVTAEFKSGLLSVVKLLTKSRQACALLKLSPRKKPTNCTCQPIKCSRNIPFDGTMSDFRNMEEESHNSDSGSVEEDVYEFKETPERKCYCTPADELLSDTPTLIDIKRKINSCKYVSVAEFNYDMINVVSATNCDDLVITYKEILSETFPWFQNETKACTDLLEEDMYDSCNLTTNSEMECDQQVPVIDLPDDIEDYFCKEITEQDDRSCLMCRGVGDGMPSEESRLVYCGQNMWVHVNCALWSAEVFEEIDGSLQNVHSAISRGRLIKCTLCGNRGATVGCNIKSCGEHFHYPCARKTNCHFLTDKTVYCSQHVSETKKKNVEIEQDFHIQRPVYVELDRKKKKMVEPDKVKFLMGSLAVKQLGGILPKLSDTSECLIPIDFLATRLYWSIKEPWKIVEYKVKTSIQNGSIGYATDCGHNFTVDHSNSINVVQIGLKQISRWHTSLNANDDDEMIIRQDRGMKQFTESLNPYDATEEEPQNNADLLPPEIKDAIFEDLPHELLDGISMLDIFPKLMIYEDILNADSKADANLSNDGTRDESLSEENGVDSYRRDDSEGADLSAHWSINIGFNPVEDALLSSSRPACSNRDIKRNRSLGSNRNQHRSSALAFNCKVDGSSAAKRRKLSKDIRIPESVLISIGRKKDDSSLLERHRTLQSDDIKTKNFNWSAAKKYASSSMDLNSEINIKAREISGKLKISQLDGMDDLSDVELSGNSDCPVKCDRCNCAYRTQESYHRHLAHCEPLSTSESESESARSPPIQMQTMLITETGAVMNENLHHKNVAIVQNLNQSTFNTGQTVLNPLTSGPQSFQIQNAPNTSIPLGQLNQGVSNIIFGNGHHSANHFFPLQTMSVSGTTQVPTVSMSTVPISSVQTVQNHQSQMFTMSAPNGNGQHLVTIAPQQNHLPNQTANSTQISNAFTHQNLYRTNDDNTQNMSKTIQISPAGKQIKQKITSQVTSKPIQMKQILQRAVVNDNNVQSPGIILQPTNTQPLFVQQVGQAPHNLMSYITDGHNQPVQYLTVPSGQELKPQTHNAFLAPATSLMQGAFLQTDQAGNIILSNASGGLQMLSAAPLQLAQQQQPQVIGTLIQPQSGTVQYGGGVVSTEQMMLSAAPQSLEMVTNPTMVLASQPVYYGLETIVQNTVMSSQQFVSTAMQGVLSQNASFSATTTQVFQASKIEPIMEVPGGYVVLNNVDSTTIMQQPSAQSNIMTTNVLQQPFTQLQPQVQVAPQQMNKHTIYNISNHSTSQQAGCVVPQTAQKTNIIQNSTEDPSGKQTPMIVTKIQPQIVNKVMPNISISAAKFVNDNSSISNKPNSVNIGPDQSVTVQPVAMNKPPVIKAAPLSMSQQYNLKPKVTVPSANNSSVINIQPVQRKLNMIRPISKSSAVTLKPKLMSKPVKQKPVNTPLKTLSQTPSLIAPKPKYPLENKTFSNINTAATHDKRASLKFNVSSLDNNVPELNYLQQQQSIVEKGGLPASVHTSLPQNTANINNTLYQQSNIAYNGNNSVNTSQAVTMHTNSIQLPSAPFNSPYSSNIPTNIVNPIQQSTNNQSNNTVLRPTNRVLPMQTIHKPSYDADGEKIAEIKAGSKVEVADKEMKIIVSPIPEKSDVPEKTDTNSIDESNVASNAVNDVQYTTKVTECKPIENDNENMNSDFNMKTISDDITDNDDRSENNVTEVKEKISKILKNLDDECDSITFSKKEELDICEEKCQKENIDPRDNLEVMRKVQNSSHKPETELKKIPSGPHILYEIQSEDGFVFKSTSISEIWEKIFEAVQIARKVHGLFTLPEGPLADMSGAQMLGLKTNALRYLIEQLPGAQRCRKYTPKYHKRDEGANFAEYLSDQEELRENPYGAARCQPFLERSSFDMFSWLASRHRKQPVHVVIQPSDNELLPRRGTGSNLPMAMKYRTLKETYKDYVGVFRSHIHGRGLYCTRDIEAGEMVIEYAGELIRSTLTDKRERYYDSKNIGCYMFKIDDNLVVDATMRGNAARFINHSCEPNCYSKVVDILGHKHIIIFALRRIVQGEELTYDYKFPFEDDKIPCSCRSRKCRKYLN